MKKYTINNLYWSNGQMYHCDTYGMENLVKECESDNLQECKENLLRLENDFIEEIKELEEPEFIVLEIYSTDTDLTYYTKEINLEKK